MALAVSRFLPDVDAAAWPPGCDPGGDNNDLQHSIWLVQERYGGSFVHTDDPKALQIWLAGDAPTGEAAQTVLKVVNGGV